MEQGLTRRDFLKVSGAALAGAYALSLAGCGGGGSGTGQLQVTWWGAQERNDRTLEAIKIFENQNPNVNVRASYTGDFTAYFNKLTTQVTGGNAPDVVQMDLQYIKQYADQGVLLDLSEYEGDALDLSGFDKEFLANGEVDGKLVGVPIAINAPTAFYDPAILEQAGVEAPDRTWTWDDLSEVAGAISEGTPEGVYGLQDMGWWNTGLELFVRPKGKSLFTEGGKLGFAKDDLAEWLAYWDDLRESGAGVPDRLLVDSSGSPDKWPIVTGKAGMSFAWSNQLAALWDLSGHKIQTNMPPNRSSSSGSGTYLKASMLWSGYSRTQNPETVAEFISFFVNDPKAALALGAERGIPPVSEIRKKLGPQLTGADEASLEYINLVIENSTPPPPPPPPGNIEVSSALGRANEAVAFGEATIDQAVDRFFDEAESALS